jgi:hypothetical protein
MLLRGYPRKGAGMTDIHSCGYYCDKPLCIKAQRDELRDKLFAKKWQGLTDEEIMSLLPGAVRLPPGWADTVRAIEAKLKEKNT